MNQRSVRTVGTLAAIVAMTALTAAQTPAAKTSPAAGKALPRTADGRPDFQGNWSTATYTPFERPNEFKGREYFTADEAEAYAKRAIERMNAQPEDEAHYENSIWMTEKMPRGMTSLRTSIVLTPDGKVPPVNQEGQKRAQERAAARRGIGQYDSAQSRGLSERCIYWGHEGPPLLPTGYNNNLHIHQAPGTFVIIPEMMPVARIVPLDARPHVSDAIRSIRGDSRGWWDGDTMVVETTNFTNRTAFRGSSEYLKVTERLTLTDADTIRYEFTVDDPHTWDTPWKGEYTMKRTTDQIYEYACHEGNYGMVNILKGQRKVEEDAAKAKAAGAPSSQQQ